MKNHDNIRVEILLPAIIELVVSPKPGAEERPEAEAAVVAENAYDACPSSRALMSTVRKKVPKNATGYR
jgi:hypothetical protein